MWVAPVLSATGDLITAALYAINYHNLRYLKGMDGPVVMDSPLQFSPGQPFPLGCNNHGWASGRVLDVPYQNTMDSVRIVILSVILNSASDTVSLRYGPTSTTNMAQSTIIKSPTGGMFLPAIMVVPPGYYYKASKDAGAPVIHYWWECNLGN